MDTSYQALQQLLQPHIRSMGAAADIIMDQHVSSYPVFVAYVQPVEIGIPLLSPQTPGEDLGIQASTLEELAARQVVQLEKVDDFRAVYKNPKTHVCILVFQENRAEFVFLPR